MTTAGVPNFPNQQAQSPSQENRWETFLAELDAALQANPRDVALWREKAKALVALNRRQEVLTVYDRMLEIAPQQAALYAERAQVLDSLGRSEEALEGYNRALQLEPLNLPLLKTKALLLARLKRIPEAIAVYDRILQARPEDPEYLIDKGDALISAGNIEEAIANFEKAEILAPNNFGAREWTSRGDNLFAASKGEDALKFFDRALAADKSYAWAHRGRALVLADILNETAEALQESDRAIALDPDNALFYLEKGNVYNQRGEYEPAAECYNRAIQIDPKYLVARLNLCVVLEAKGNFDQALAAAANAIEVDPKSSDAWLHQGYCLGALERHEDAIASYSKVLELNPDDFWGNNNHGWSLARLGRHEEALPFYERAVKIDPTRQEAWTNRARSLCKLQHCDEALRSLYEALELVPDKTDILGSIGTVYADFMFQPEKALEVIQQRLEIDPDDKGARSDLADCLIQAGRFQDGRAEAEKLVGHLESKALELALSILVLASYALEGDLAGRARQFDIVLARLEECFPPGTPVKREETWEFGGVRNKMLRSNVSAESRFMVFTAIDMQGGDLNQNELSFFKSPEPQPATGDEAGSPHVKSTA